MSRDANARYSGTGTTRYSGEIKGDTRNHDLSVEFDVTDGYVGITQQKGRGKDLDRVLLTPNQLASLIKFAAGKLP